MSTYTKQIKFEKYLYETWIPQVLSTTNDAVWIHLQQLQIRKDVRNVVVVDI